MSDSSAWLSAMPLPICFDLSLEQAHGKRRSTLHFEIFWDSSRFKKKMPHLRIWQGTNLGSANREGHDTRAEKYPELSNVTGKADYAFKRDTDSTRLLDCCGGLPGGT